MVNFLRIMQGLAESTRERHIRQAEELEARQYRMDYDEDDTSDCYDTGGLATIEDYESAGMTDDGQIFIGIDPKTGEYLYDSGDYSIQIFGLPGIGKGSTFIQTNLAHIDAQTSIVCFGLSGENYRVAASYRRDTLGQLVVCDNADELAGIEAKHSVSIDVLGHIKAVSNRNDISPKDKLRKIEDLSDEYRMVGIPMAPDDKGQAAWIGREARKTLSSLLTFGGIDMPKLLDLPELHDFLSEAPSVVFELVLQFTTVPSVRNRFEKLKREYESGADKQTEWVIGRILDELECYRKGSARGDALNGRIFDVGQMRSRPTTLFIEMDEDSLDRDGAHMSRIMTCITGQLAGAEGNVPVVFLIDEASQMPAWPLDRSIRVYRKHGLRFLSFWQSQSSGETVFGDKRFADIMESSGMRLHFSCSSESTARKLQQRAGDFTSFGRSTAINRGGYGASENISERALPRLPMADILNMPRHGLIIDKNGLPLGKAARQPWWELEPYNQRIKHFNDM